MSDAATQGTAPPDEVSRELRIAAVLVLAQAAALAVLAVVLTVKALTGHPHSLGGALGIAGFAVLGAVVLGLCGRGLRRGLRSSVSPVIVIEVPAAAVGFSLGLQAGRPGYGLPILLSALAILVLLFSPGGRRGI
ncbi:MAG TPA: hypothetical protein VHI14_10710 [Jatrophihabitantaceae bacterium]|nr:hypothetical protein [Jatrophihabitantaceae bacterium]